MPIENKNLSPKQQSAIGMLTMVTETTSNTQVRLAPHGGHVDQTLTIIASSMVETDNTIVHVAYIGSDRKIEQLKSMSSIRTRLASRFFGDHLTSLAYETTDEDHEEIRDFNDELRGTGKLIRKHLNDETSPLGSSVSRLKGWSGDDLLSPDDLAFAVNEAGKEIQDDHIAVNIILGLDDLDDPVEFVSSFKNKTNELCVFVVSEHTMYNVSMVEGKKMEKELQALMARRPEKGFLH